MELWAAGFNAWRQLEFDERTPEEDSPLVHDFLTFRKVFEDDQIMNVWASISATRVASTSGLHSAGLLEDCWTANLGLQVFCPNMAINGSGVIAVYDKITGAVNQYASANDYLSGTDMVTKGGLGDILQIVAYENGFAALNTTGQVWTWGSEQCLPCLGRDTDDAHPANVPGIVNDLLQLPTGKIIKIAAGGHLIMALTEGNDLYIWGGHPGLPAALTGLTMYPTPFTGDVMDFATGANHAVILTLEGDLFGTGDNRNGQLGLTTISRLSSWTKLSRAWGPGKSIFAVACGPRSTFLKIR